MKAFAYKALAGAGLLITSGAAWACADSSCYPTWKLFGGGDSCEGRAFLAPGNDTRVNLLFLLRDRGGNVSEARGSRQGGSGDADGEGAYLDPLMGEGFGEVFVDPYIVRASFYPQRKQSAETSAYEGTRCAGFAAASKALAAAMQASKGLPSAESGALNAARSVSEVTCTSGNDGVARQGLAAWPTVTSRPGREFLGYIQAADAFYAGQWDQSRTALAALGSAGDPWVRETAAYLLIRTEYAAAQAGAFSEYGDFELAKVDRSSVKRGLVANAAYLKAWPAGRYAASAQGLVRRVNLIKRLDFIILF